MSTPDLFKMDADGRVRTTWRAIGWMISITAAGAIAWAVTQQTVLRHSDDIKELKTDAQSNRELLLRIDERTSEIKRRLDARP